MRANPDQLPRLASIAPDRRPVWGGVAFTIEYDQQMFFRRAKALQLSWWDTPYLEELIAKDVLDN